VCERSRFLAWDFLEGSAMVHIERRGRAGWIFVGVLIIVGFLGLRWAAISEAQVQDRDQQIEELRQAEQEARARAEAARRLAVQAQDEAAKKVEELKNAAAEAARKAEELARAVAEAAKKAVPPPQRHFLEKGKSYLFYPLITVSPAVVLEEPRENWVKVRWNDTDQWINLNLVHRITAASEGKEKKGTDKAMAEAMARWNMLAEGVKVPSGGGMVGFTWEADRFPHPTFSGGRAEAYGAFARLLVQFLDEKGNFDYLAENNLFTTQLRYMYAGGKDAKVDWAIGKSISDLSQPEAFGDHDEATRKALKAYADKIAERAKKDKDKP
jgi:hypothetical protein